MSSSAASENSARTQQFRDKTALPESITGSVISIEEAREFVNSDQTTVLYAPQIKTFIDTQDHLSRAMSAACLVSHAKHVPAPSSTSISEGIDINPESFLSDQAAIISAADAENDGIHHKRVTVPTVAQLLYEASLEHPTVLSHENENGEPARSAWVLPGRLLAM
jgi:hypothetical protein